jgi:ribonuclease HI
MGTNIKYELSPLFYLLKCAGEHGLSNVQVFGDSKLVIDRMTKSLHLANMDLLQLAMRVKSIATRFSSISFQHIFNELNSATYSLCKYSFLIPQNQMV